MKKTIAIIALATMSLGTAFAQSTTVTKKETKTAVTPDKKAKETTTVTRKDGATRGTKSTKKAVHPEKTTTTKTTTAAAVKK